ncbi:MAG: cupredoxin domain-containing protein [Steroidobacterales bacterium]
MKQLRRHWLLSLIAAVALVGTAWTGLAPIRSPTREALFEIPQGTWARRMSGTKVEILPAQIRLTLGLRDVLVLKNLDDVPQIFGPTLMMPGQSLHLPFEVASSYTFACTAHLSGQMTIVVEPRPDTAWARIRWRVRELLT